MTDPDDELTVEDVRRLHAIAEAGTWLGTGNARTIHRHRAFLLAQIDRQTADTARIINGVLLSPLGQTMVENQRLLAEVDRLTAENARLRGGEVFVVLEGEPHDGFAEVIAVFRAREAAEALEDANRFYSVQESLLDPVLPARCTGVTARWCPIHGDCRCDPDQHPYGDADMNDPACPLHSPTSAHGEVRSDGC